MGRVQRGDGSPLSAFNPCLFKALDFVHALNICDIFGQQDHPRGRQRLPFCPNIPPDRTGKKHNTRPMKRPQEAVVFFVAIPIEIFILLCYTIHTCGCSSSVELRLPKPIRWVRLPSSAPRKNANLSTRQVSVFMPFGAKTVKILQNQWKSGHRAVKKLPHDRIFRISEQIYP